MAGGSRVGWIGANYRVRHVQSSIFLSYMLSPAHHRLGATLGVIRSRSSSKHRGSSSFDGSNTTSNTSNTTTNAFIDPETPEAAYTIRSINGSGTEYILVYSDEFNVDGRSFAEGEDAFWQADDLHDFMV
jgi:hypothetical protein